MKISVAPYMTVKEAERNACPLHPFVILCRGKKAFIRARDEYTESRAALTADYEKPAAPPGRMKTSTAPSVKQEQFRLKKHMCCV